MLDSSTDLLDSVIRYKVIDIGNGLPDDLECNSNAILYRSIGPSNSAKDQIIRRPPRVHLIKSFVVKGEWVRIDVRDSLISAKHVGACPPVPVSLLRYSCYTEIGKNL